MQRATRRRPGLALRRRRTRTVAGLFPGRGTFPRIRLAMNPFMGQIYIQHYLGLRACRSFRTTLRWYDLGALLLDPKSHKPSERPLYFHYPHYGNQGGRPGGSIRLGKWKLIEDFESGNQRLFDLSQDIGETRDVAQDHSLMFAQTFITLMCMAKRNRSPQSCQKSIQIISIK